MKKIYLIGVMIAFFCTINNYQAQVNTPNTTATDNHIPNIIPPTPTVASLMKFEEIPVSNYTGVPDVSIPLFNIATNFGFNVNLAMKYHPLSIKKDEISGYTGLGWNLFAGGTISRTVRDIPDEYYRAAGMLNTEKIGIYDSRNNYYDVIPLLDVNALIDETNPEINEFLFEVSEKQKYDSKHDLYQYNFMGYSGRFIIEKLGDNYNVVKLSKDNLKISYNFSNQSFEIIDNNGLKYIFDVKEQSKSSSFNENVTFTGDSSISPSNNYEYTSAFHLSSVSYETNILAEFLYNTDNELLIEKQGTKNTVNNVPILPDLNFFINAHQQGTCEGHIPSSLLPLNSYQTTNVETKTKKLKQIKVIDKGIINFITLKGNRLDQNIFNASDTPYLNKISISDWNGKEIKSYNFVYSFIDKLFLKDIVETSVTNEISKYSFIYKNNSLSPADFKTDYWGYYKLPGTDCDKTFFDNELIENRNVDKQYITKDVLTQITYPTKGSAIFEYEPNTYSYWGDFSIPTNLDNNDYFESFENNPDNWTITTFNEVFLQSSNGNEQTQNLGIFNTNRTLILQSSIDNNEGIAGILKLYKRNSAHQIVQTIGLQTLCPQEIVLEGGFEYVIGFVWNHQTQIGDNPNPNVPVIGHASIFIDEKTRNLITEKWLYGGGIRIKNIYYLDKVDNAASTDIINQGYPNNFDKRVSFKYNFFNDDKRSSGSIVFPKPIMSYIAGRVFRYTGFTCNLDPGLWDIKYRINTQFNNLSAIATQGGDVGYKNVTVFETDKGKSEYIYTSPIDYPESIGSASAAYPFVPTKNIDYKRGLLLSEKKYDDNGRILTSNDNAYNFEDYEKITGVNVYYKNFDCPFASRYASYFAYKSDINSSTCTFNGNLMCYNTKQCGPDATSFLTYHLNKEAFGWAKLINSATKNYFYNANNVQKIIEINTAYTYSINNMQPLKQTTTTDGVIQETSYSYAHEKNNPLLIDKNMIGIPLETTSTQTVNGVTKTLSKTETVYPTSIPTSQAGNSVLPLSVKSFDLQNNVPSTEVTYDRYDSKGNLQQYTTKDGISTAIVWGYNSTQPIAKVE
ncbi:hypothetical protein N0B16_14090, partial [Chryseobacterium sp. GMJ5]